MNRIILASASPQRKQLLSQLIDSFEIIPSQVDEEAFEESDPAERSMNLAELKAEDVYSKHDRAVVIGCDTLVVAANGTLLEKPKNEAEARSMMSLHSGNLSVVHSGLCVIGEDGMRHKGIASSNVYFKDFTPDDIDWWISTNLWQGRSGGFQIDGHGQILIHKIAGDWPGIVGLPTFLLHQLLLKAGVDIRASQF